MEDIRQITSEKQSISFWKIIRDGEKRPLKGEKLLASMMIPATFEQCSIQIARLLSHYPSRDSLKDAMVIDDITGALVKNGAYLVAIAEEVDEIWLSGTKDEPFRLASGEIVSRILKRCEGYRKLYLLWHKPRPIAQIQQQEEQQKFWNDLSDSEKQNVLKTAESLSESQKNIYFNSYKIPENERV